LSSGGGVAIGSGLDVWLTEGLSLTGGLSISSSSEAVDDELADEGGVANRGLGEAIRFEIMAGSLTFRRG